MELNVLNVIEITYKIEQWKKYTMVKHELWKLVSEPNHNLKHDFSTNTIPNN